MLKIKKGVTYALDGAGDLTVRALSDAFINDVGEQLTSNIVLHTKANGSMSVRHEKQYYWLASASWIPFPQKEDIWLDLERAVSNIRDNE